MQQARTRSYLMLLAVVWLLTISVLRVHSLTAQVDRVPWSAWATLDITTIDDDNTGSAVARSQAVVTPGGTLALKITPSGSAEETKLAIPLKGSALADWAAYAGLEVEVMLPQGNTDNANRFFMGMADVTGGGFGWIAGVFGSDDVTTGWNTITFPLDPAMRDLNPEHDYNLYFSFFKEQGGKIPLTEPLYLGAMVLVPDTNTGAAPANYAQEVEQMLTLDDVALIDVVARETFDFFWLEANPVNGLIKDRSTPDSVASIAAVGFGLAAIPVGVDRGWITYDEGYERTLTTLQTFTGGGVEGERGFFFHFVDMQTGEREWSSELSSIDTALLAAGALVAGAYFQDTEVQSLANQLYEAIEWDWMTRGGTHIKMGWTPENGFLDAAWDHFDESMILYVLAIGSPTHPIPAAAWEAWRRPVNSKGGYIYLPGEPLFVYQYPLAFLNLRGMEDAYANYWNNTARACERNQQFAVEKSAKFLTYQAGVWGLSASDGPTGYRAYGAAEANHDGTVAPYAAAACLPFTPELALSGMRAMLQTYGARVWREYGFVSAINADKAWYSRAHIGIDQGDILLMLANAQDGIVWNLFMANPPVQTALNAMGFVTSPGDYAVTPAYLAKVTGQP